VIASLNGILAHRSPEHLIVDVGGVGYKVVVSLHTFSRLPALGERLFLYMHTSVREDDIALFGFLDEREKKIFQKLINVSGIGPKLALTILSGIGPEDLIQAITREDLLRLTTITGVGKKTAERVILDLKDRLAEFLVAGAPTSTGTGRQILQEALSALTNLGYSRPVAERTLSQVPLKEGVRLETVLREALKSLSETRP